MSKEGRDLVSEAVNDAKALKEAALSAAKNELLESMAPALRDLLEKNIKGVLSKNEDTDRLRRGIQDNWPGESHTGFEEAKEKGEPKMDKDNKPNGEQELDLESLAAFFPAMSEMPEGDPMAPPVAEDPSAMMPSIPTLGEKAVEGEEGEEGEDLAALAIKKEAKSKEDEPMDEEIEISESELKKVYEAALQTEAQVTKGFGEMTKAGELDAVVKDAGKGLNPEKKGEHEWDKEEPPAKQDFMMKEAIRKGYAENAALRENLKKAVGMIRALGARLHEVNLFNAKVLHVNRVLNTHGRLSTEQKKVVLESIDKAKTIDEVKMVFEAINNSFAVTARLSESRKPAANAQRPRTSGTPDQKVLSESVDHNSGTFSRLAQLAGIVK
jgi:hypothetical protein